MLLKEKRGNGRLVRTGVWVLGVVRGGSERSMPVSAGYAAPPKCRSNVVSIRRSFNVS